MPLPASETKPYAGHTHRQMRKLQNGLVPIEIAGDSDRHLDSGAAVPLAGAASRAENKTRQQHADSTAVTHAATPASSRYSIHPGR